MSISPRTAVQSSRRRSVDLRRCVPSYHAEWTSLRRYRRSSSTSRRSGSFLKRHWHRDGETQSANGSLGAEAARIFRPASSCTAAQHSRAATIVTAEYFAGPMARPVFSGGRAKSVIQIGKTQSASTSRTCRRSALDIRVAHFLSAPRSSKFRFGGRVPRQASSRIWGSGG